MFELHFQVVYALGLWSRSFKLVQVLMGFDL